MPALSDIALLAAFGLSLVFVVDYGVGSPWYKDPLGWVIFLYGVSTSLVLGLIAYAIVFEQKVDEPLRLLAAVFISGSLLAKTIILHHERKLGRRERYARK